MSKLSLGNKTSEFFGYIDKAIEQLDPAGKHPRLRIKRAKQALENAKTLIERQVRAMQEMERAYNGQGPTRG